PRLRPVRDRFRRRHLRHPARHEPPLRHPLPLRGTGRVMGTYRHSELAEESLSDPSQRGRSEISAPGQIRKRAEWLLTNAALLLVIVAFGAPFLWIVAAALNRAQVTSWPWPSSPTLANFRTLFDKQDAGRALRNSLIVSLSTMVLATVTSSLARYRLSPAVYGLSRIPSRRKAVSAYAVLLLQSTPLAVTMVPIYALAVRLKLQDTYRGLILTHTAISLPLLVWLMKGFCDAVPRDSE